MIDILIAEDNAAYRRMLHRLLSGRFPFVQITETADGVDALHRALARRYDLLFIDVRLPQGNGLDLTRAIKAVHADSMVCVTTGFDLPEYRDAALRQGADRFLVKGESTGEEIVAIVESLLAGRYRTLVLIADALSRRQVTMLLSIHWPAMIVADAADARAGFDTSSVLRPDLTLVELGLPDIDLAEMIRTSRARNPRARFVGMTADGSHALGARAMRHAVDYCVSLEPAGHTELVAIVDTLQKARVRG